MAGDGSTIYNIFQYIWTYKVQILGGLFIALTAFEFFYRVHLKVKRRQQLKELKTIFRKIIKIKIKKMDLETARDKVIINEVEKLAYKIDTNNKLYNIKLDTSIKHIMIKSDSEMEVLNMRFDKLDKNTEEVRDIATEGIKRIEILETQTDFINVIGKYKKTILAVLGLIGISNIKPIKAWISNVWPF